MTNPLARAVMLVCAVFLVGCVPAPGEESTSASPEPTSRIVRPDDDGARVSPAILHGTSMERVARRLTVRVRARGCGQLGTASGVAVGPHLLVTNRHVVEGAEALELNFWDGTSAHARPTSLAVVDDLALVQVSLRLPAVARLASPDVAERADVLVVGYPNGGEQTIEPGEVVEYARLRAPADASPVMRMSAEIVPGNSGGAVVDRTGALAGIVFGVETETGYGLAIPASAVADLLADGGAVTRPACT